MHAHVQHDMSKQICIWGLGILKRPVAAQNMQGNEKLQQRTGNAEKLSIVPKSELHSGKNQVVGAVVTYTWMLEYLSHINATMRST